MVTAFNVSVSLLYFLKYPDLKAKFDFKAHEGEIEDLDITPDKKVMRHFKDCPRNHVYAFGLFVTLVCFVLCSTW